MDGSDNSATSYFPTKQNERKKEITSVHDTLGSMKKISNVIQQ